MTNQQICDFYDNTPNLTLTQLSQITGLTVEQLKTILQSPPAVQFYARRRGASSNYRG